MKIAYVNGGRRVPSVRFRTSFFKLLAQRGHECHFYSSMPGRYEHYRLIGWRRSERLRRWVRKWHLFRMGDIQYDSVVLETGLLHEDDAILEQQLRRVSGRLVYDLDDAVFLLFPNKTELIARLADRVIVANEKLADWARQFNRCVSIIPTCVDADIYTGKDYRSNDRSNPAVVGWIGSAGNVKMLSVCAPALRQLAAQRQFQLRIITSDRREVQKLDLSGVDVAWVNIDRCNIVRELQRLDVGLMPLPGDEPWMEYKCNAKAIQCMAVGVPVVASALGFNQELIDHGTNSLLVGDQDQWVDSLQALLDSAELRSTLGRAARETILERFTVQRRIDEYERAVFGAKYRAEKHDWTPAR